MNHDELKYFGKNVKEYRELYGWKPFQLGRQCLTSAQYILDVENGKCPDASLVCRISKIFNVSIDKLLAPPEKVVKVMSDKEREQLESIAEHFGLNKEAMLAPRDKRIQNGVLKTPVESIDFELIDEKIKTDVAKTVCVLRELGFNVGIGSQYGAHSIDVYGLMLNISHSPKTVKQRKDPLAEEDNLIDYILNGASGDDIDKILNRKHRVPFGKDLKKILKNYTENRNEKLGDLSWVSLDE